MPLLNIPAPRHAPVTPDPFSFTVVPDFITPANAPTLRRDFPAIAYPGLLPVEANSYGPSFAELIAELQSPAIARAFSEKFDIDLTGRSTMITVGGRYQQKDGRIHTDSTATLVTALLNFNDRWGPQGGRLRPLRRPDDLTEMIAAVPRDFGALVGVRRYVMINWMASTFAAKRELLKHRLSATANRTFAHLPTLVAETA
jgi:SM-20-related protein